MIVDHSSLTALVIKQHLTSARQRRYAMDLCEVCPEILHRAGSQLWIPDMLSRLGYPTDKSMVEDEKLMSSADKTKIEDEKLMRANYNRLQNRIVEMGYPRQNAMDAGAWVQS